MSPNIKNYLNDIRAHLHLDPFTERQLITELYSYFYEKICELRARGLSERDADREAIKSCGHPRIVARLMYEACSKGSWTETGISCLPHLLIAGLFILHLWNHITLTSIVFFLIVSVTLFGWWRGKPGWLYPWIGYALFPLLIGGFASWTVFEQFTSFIAGSSHLPEVWKLLAATALLLFSIWIIVRTTIRVVKRDWILASVMLVPLPVMGSWLYNFWQAGSSFQSASIIIQRWDASIGLVLVILAITSAVFIRLRQRVLKVMAIITMSIVVGNIVAHNLLGDPGLLGGRAAAHLGLLFLLSPALLEARIGHGELNEDAWWSGVLTPNS